jgi:hypothetical protein
MRIPFRVSVCGLVAVITSLPLICARSAEAEHAPSDTVIADVTPHLADGHPDLNGNWQGVTGSVFMRAFPKGDAAQGSINVGIMQAGTQAAFLSRARVGVGTRRPNEPAYRDKEQLSKSDALYANGSRMDRVALCGQPGLPRIGAPNKIIQTATEVVFLYSDLAGMVWRVVPTDGRGFRDRVDPSFYGDSVGHWEGDTLVVEARGFTDQTWFGEYGYVHSDQMHVIERLRRKGLTLTYQATVEDPLLLSEPWVKPAVSLEYTDVQIEEPLQCVPTTYDQGHHEQRVP